MGLDWDVIQYRDFSNRKYWSFPHKNKMLYRGDYKEQQEQSIKQLKHLWLHRMYCYLMLWIWYDLMDFLD
jgi:hypothetical protein